jgi:hypothetical protein
VFLENSAGSFLGGPAVSGGFFTQARGNCQNSPAAATLLLSDLAGGFRLAV